MADRTPIIVATIGLIGTVTVGLLANSDKVSSFFAGTATGGDPGKDPVTAPSGNTLEAIGNTTGVESGNPPQTANILDPAPPVETNPDATGTTSTPTPPSNLSSVKLAGVWTSDDGYNFTFKQSDASFSYVAREKDLFRGAGNGTIAGNRLAYSFTSLQGNGACTATVPDDQNSIVGSCHMNDQAWKTWPFEIKRLSVIRPGPLIFHHVP